MQAIRCENVGIRYITGDFKDIGLKEYVIRRLKGQYEVREFWADRDISFSLERGDMLGIVGANGAGKSTLLKAVSGIMVPTVGSMEVNGSVAALLELGSGFDQDLTVRENTFLRGAMLGYTRKFMEEKYDEIIAFAELEDFQDRPFKQLSSGMKSRLAFSIACLVQPDILILDEVLSVGDGAFRKKSGEKMKEILASGVTGILVSHSVSQVRELCNKVLWIDHGRQILFSDDVNAACDAYEEFLKTKKLPADAAEPKVQTVEYIKAKPAPERLPEYPGRYRGFDLLVYFAAYTAVFALTLFLTTIALRAEGMLFSSGGDGLQFHFPPLVNRGIYLRQVIDGFLHGDFHIPLFDINLALGGDVLTTMMPMNPITNPLLALSVFVPVQNTEVLYNVLIVLRMYLAGLAFSAFCLDKGKARSFTLTGAVIYVFSGFTIATINQPGVMDVLYQFPILLLGLDRVMEKGKEGLFAFAVFYTAMQGFYFLYMMTLWMAVYVLIVFFQYAKEDRGRRFVRMVGRIAGTYLLGLGLAAVYFVPSVLSYFLSSRSMGTTHVQTLFTKQVYADRLFSFFSPWNAFNIGGVDYLSMSVLVLFASVVLFMAKGKEYRSARLLLIASLVMFVIPVFGWVLCGFSYEQERWDFMLVFLMAYIVVLMLPSLLTMGKKQKLGCAAAAVLWLALVILSKRNVYTLAGAALVCGMGMVLLLCGEDGCMDVLGRICGRQRMAALLLLAAVVGNVSVNFYFNFAPGLGNHARNDYYENGYYTKHLLNSAEFDAAAHISDRSGRFEGTDFYVTEGICAGIPTMGSYFNLVNGNVIDMWARLENIRQDFISMRLFGSDWRTIFTTLLANKYFVTGEGDESWRPYGYRLLETTEKNNRIFENEYALPWGYTYDSAVAYATTDGLDGLALEESMLRTIALDDPEQAGVPVLSGTESEIQSCNYEIADMKGIVWENGVFDVGEANAFMTIRFDPKENAEMYLRLDKFVIDDPLGSTGITVQHRDISRKVTALGPEKTYYEGREDFLFNLGFSEDETGECTVVFSKKGTYRLNDVQVLALPMDNYPERVEALRDEPLENIQMNANRISGTVSLSKSKVLCMSVPYSTGWKATVDGEPVKILRGNYMFMAVPLEAGQHEIVFTYCTPGLKAGAAISAASLAILAAVLVVRRRKRAPAI